MQRMIVRYLTGAALGFAVATLAGCGREPSQKASLAPLAGPTSQATSPAGGLRPIRDQTSTLPSMECLVNEHGIRVKVLPVRSGRTCLDQVPSEEVGESSLKSYRLYYIFEVYPRQVGTMLRRYSRVGWAPGTLIRWDPRVGGSDGLPGFVNSRPGSRRPGGERLGRAAGVPGPREEALYTLGRLAERIRELRSRRKVLETNGKETRFALWQLRERRNAETEKRRRLHDRERRLQMELRQVNRQLEEARQMETWLHRQVDDSAEEQDADWEEPGLP
jgi:hypothetical protein